MVTCNYCDHQFSGGATRIADHIRDKCKCKDDDRKEEFLGLKKQLEALHLKDKLQKAGYEAKTVKWDSDSDSDESDDEKDLMQ